jgi:hypothetical protein
MFLFMALILYSASFLCVLYSKDMVLYFVMFVFIPHGMFTEIRGDTTRKIVIGGIISSGKARLQT